MLKPTKVTRREYTRRDEKYLLDNILAIALSQPRLRSVLHNLPDTYLTGTSGKAKYHLLGEKIEVDSELADKLAELEIVADRVADLGGAELRVSTTQIGWARRRGFAFLWNPQRWLGQRGAPLVLTLGLPERDPTPRWKEVVEIRPGLYTHHLEVRAVEDVDDEVLTWVDRAYAAAT